MGKGKGKRNKARKQYDANEFEIEQDENFYKKPVDNHPIWEYNSFAAKAVV